MEISTSFLLLLISSSVKAVFLAILTFDMIKRWNAQSKKYFTDFPLLMGVTFLFFTIGKILDVFLYIYLREESSSAQMFSSTVKYAELCGRIRFLNTFLTAFPYFILMLIIWFENKKSVQYSILCIWASISIGGIMLSRNYQSLLIMNFIITVIPVILSIITYFIMHNNRKMPAINNLVLAFGWMVFILFQMIRPIFQTIGNSIWGSLWIIELLDILPLGLIWYGFKTPSNYHKPKLIRQHRAMVEDNNRSEQYLEDELNPIYQ